MGTTEELSALDAARRLGVQLNYLYGLLRLGRLAGRKVDGEWRVRIRAVEERLERRHRIIDIYNGQKMGTGGGQQ